MEDKRSVVKDPRGYLIALSERRYQDHIVQESGHVDVPQGDILKAVEQPVVIYESSRRPTRDVYFGKCSSVHPPLYVKVAAEISEETKRGEVVTAFLSKQIGGGINEEKGPKYIGYSNQLR